MSEHKVSVIVPAFNAEATIGSCIESILAQNYTNFELIVIDDGSVDETIEVVEKYASLDNRIKLISERTDIHGPAAARNRGIRYASGDLITFVDADDCVDEMLLKEYVDKYIDEPNSTLVVSSARWDYYNDDTIRKTEVKRIDGFDETGRLTIHDLPRLSEARLFNCVFNKCFVLKLIRDNDLCFAEEMRIAEDLDFIANYLSVAGGEWFYIDKPLYQYFIRNQKSLNSAFYDESIKHVKCAFHKYIDLVKGYEECSQEDIDIINTILIEDWTFRLSCLWEGRNDNGMTKNDIIRYANAQIRSEEYVNLLNEVGKGGHFSRIKYYALKTGHFIIFVLLREVSKNV